MSDLITNNLAIQQNAIQALQRTETPGACLTLTRTSTLAITTAGTLITWQTATRTNGITFATTDITIPTSGYYAMSLTYIANTSHTSSMRLFVAGVNLVFMAAAGVNSTRQGFMWLRYFTAADVLSFNVLPSTNVTIQVNAENSASESPILHIVQLTGSQT